MPEQETVYVANVQNYRSSGVYHLFRDCGVSQPLDGFHAVGRSEVEDLRVCKRCKDIRERRERGPHYDPDPGKLASSHANALIEMDPDELGGESA